MGSNSVQFPDATVAFCAKHLAPLKAAWPLGYLEVVDGTLDEIAKEPEFLAICPYTKDDPEYNPADATRALATLSPLCCRFGRKRWRKILRKAGF
jgi:hypothetical protein